MTKAKNKINQIIFAIIIAFYISFGAKTANSQNLDSLFLNPKIDIETLLPSLDSLYIIGMENNPEMKMEMAFARSYDWNVKWIRWFWAQNVSAFYNYSFGNIPIFAGLLTLGSITTITEGYRAGVNIQISVFDVMGHRGRVNEVKEKAKGQRYKREAVAMEYRRKLALFYSDMVGYNRLFKSRNEDLLTQTIACQIAEKEYKEGTIHIAEYARQKNVLADAEAAYHESFRFYLGSLEQFEALLGVPLNKVANRKK